MTGYSKPEMITQEDVDWLIPRVGKEWLDDKIRAGQYLVVDKKTFKKSRDTGPLSVSPRELVMLKKMFSGDLIDDMFQRGDYIPVDENGNKVDRSIKIWKQKPKVVFRIERLITCKRCKELIPEDAKYCCYCSLGIPQKRGSNKRSNPSSTLPL